MALLAGAIAAALGAMLPLAAMAQDKGQLFATKEDGYARLILSFPDRDSLPPYEMRVENGVLSIEFDSPTDVLLPNVGTTLPDYISVARVDPDRRGVRLALRGGFSFNRIEAGEKLFVDLLPADWQGLPPALPQDIITELAERARLAAIKAEQDRKAAELVSLDPKANVRIGRNPTFLRLQFDWSVDTQANFVLDGKAALLAFEWPVAVNLDELLADLPPEIVKIENDVTADGAMITLDLGDDVTPRFYQISPRQYVVDIDLGGTALPDLTVASLEEKAAAADAIKASQEIAMASAAGGGALFPETGAETVRPYVTVLGSTVRVVFPFSNDTPAAVFRRGDTVWMMFDTPSGIEAPEQSDALEALASAFSVVSDGDTQLVQVDLSQDRLATLGSEGMAWVLSLGDTLLTPTEPIELARRRTIEGLFEVTANVARPNRVHQFRDPVVGDLLEVVTAYPPARGVTRSFEYVDFSALRSVHGLVIKPEGEAIEVKIEKDLAVISTPAGLTVSALDAPRKINSGIADITRGSFIDLARLEQPDTGEFVLRRDQLMADASRAEGRPRDVARLELADYYLANGFAYEAIGVLALLESELTAQDLLRKVRMSLAIADTMAGRPNDALVILNAASMAQEVDALMWRAIARADLYDFQGARQDAVDAQGVAEGYPLWVQKRFAFAAIRAAIESKDAPMASELLAEIDFASLDVAEVSLYHLLSGRVDEALGNTKEAIDTYGQVISADFRPTRAEAVYRTLAILDQKGTLNLTKATETLAAEALLWRGNPLEADMQKLLAEFYFRDGAYRLGFETVQHAVSNYPESPPINALRDEAQRVFGTLFIDGVADSLGPVDALGIYYDFRQLTPPGARGDEMIRNLARRLVKVDLLPQAAELLDYQLTNRLRGAAKSELAADLAVIYLADRRPQEAMRVLNATRLPDLPETLVRQRRILEARALIDGGRDELALDLLASMSGRDADFLRIDAHWRAKRYAQAGELLEALHGEGGSNTDLSQPARMDIIRAAVGYVLDADSFGLARLRSKFADRMVTSAEWPMFDYVTGSIETDSLEFKKVASQVSGLDSLNAFLASYRETYSGQGAMAPVVASQPGGDVASVL